MFCKPIITAWAIGLRLWTVLLSIAFSPGFAGNTQDIRFQRITIRDGLAHDSVYSLLQDEAGFMWLSTESGLCRFDGYHFLTYNHNPFEATSISYNSSGALLEAEPGKLWVGTWGGGLNLFHQDKDRFTRFRSDPALEKSLSSDRVQCLFKDEDGQLWVGTYDGGLCRFLPETQDFEVFQRQAGTSDSLAHQRVWAIASLKKDHLLVGTDRGLAVFNKTLKTFKNIPFPFSGIDGLTAPKVRSILKHGGHFYLGTNRGLFIFFPKTGVFKAYHFGPDTGRHANIRTLFLDHRDHLWIGTMDKGLYRIQPDATEPEHFFYEPNDIDTLVHNSVEAIIEDRSHVLWVATLGGLSKTDLKPAKFKKHQHIEGDPSTISANQVGTLFQDQAGNLWVGTFDGGLNRIDAQSGEVTVFGDKRQSKLPFRVVADLKEKPAGTLWLATQDAGLVRYEPDTSQFQIMAHDPNRPGSLSNNRLRMLRFGPDGFLWIATDAGINRFDPETQSIVNHHNEPLFSKIFGSHRYYCLLFDSKGRLWAGSERGLRILDSDRKSAWQFGESPSHLEGLSQIPIASMALASTGMVWIGTQAGLFAVDPETSAVRIFMKPQGLPSNTVLAILEDQNKTIWLATDQGISRLDPETERIRNFDYQDGLLSNSLNRNAALIDRQGKLYFGGRKGFNSFDPNADSGNPFPPKVVLTQIKVFDEVVLKGGAARGLSSFELPYQKNMVTFEFAALDFTAPEKNRYLYRLEGFNDRWVEVRARPSAVFTNLNAGNYTLRVRGANNDGLWNEAEFELPIRIVPPWWQSGWLYAAAALFAVLFLLGIPQLRIHILKRRSLALTKMVADQTEALRIQNQKLEEKNNELINLDNIVKIINQEWQLDRLFEALLEQGLKLFKNAQYGAFLKYNHQEEVFQFACATDQGHDGLARISLPREVALARYASGKEKLEEGVFLINRFSGLPPGHTLANFQKPAVVMVMAIELRGSIEGLLLLENYDRPDAFRNSDIEKLKRFRDHATTAVAKADLLAELAAKAKRLKDTQQLLMENAHQAGMAEVAANVLHNIGNALNSINTSTEVIHGIHQESPFPLLEKIAHLMRMHQSDIDSFFTQDATGKKVPPALIEVTQSLHKVHSSIGQEIQVLQNHLKRLRQVVNAQQEYVAIDGAVFEGHVSACLEEALQIERTILEEKQIQVVRKYDDLPIIKIQKSKLLRVLVHLINYSAQAMGHCPKRVMALHLRQSHHQVFIRIQDSSEILSREKLRTLFHQDFSGDSQTQHWSLHYCATAATEMGGNLQAESHSDGCVFTLTLPIYATD